MKLIKIFTVLLVLLGTYTFLSTPEKNTQDKREKLQEWKKNAKIAMKSAVGWQTLVNKVDRQDITDAPVIVKTIVKNIPNIQLVQKDIPLPELSREYLESAPYVKKYYEHTKTQKITEHNVLEFALKNNDIELAQKAFEGVRVNRKDLLHVSAAKLAFFYASNANCSKAVKYLNLLTPLANEKDFFINHTKKPKSRTFTFSKNTIRIWSQTTMLCSSLEDALSILAKHYPMRITNDQYLLETYVDYAIALKMAGYKQEADLLIVHAEELFKSGTFDNPHNAKPYILLYSLLFGAPEEPYAHYMDYVKKYRIDNPDSPLINNSFLYLIADKFIMKNEFGKALEVMQNSKITHQTGLNLMIEHASKSLKNDVQIEFFNNLANTLQTTSPFNNYYLYEPLLKIALRLTELGEQEKAEALINNAFDYLENGEQATKDKYFKKRSIETLGKYLIFMEKIEQGKKLLNHYPEIKSTQLYKAWGALYGHYIYKNNDNATEEIKNKNGAYTISAAIDYLIYKDNWVKAEKLAQQLKEGQIIGQYKTFSNRKMGLTFNDTYHFSRLRSFQFNDSSIINAKLCRLYDHCK